ncbi:hypothetical protein JYT76_01185 [Olleya sp. AH-315-F22]|nr:hypothetical protein [Olleya sp. AH-315-F22]
MIKENRTSKYLLYAIGEIVLVVIGILIALQINNWNEKKNQNALVNTYLKNFVEDLKNDAESFKLTKNDQVFKFHSLQYLLTLINEKPVNSRPNETVDPLTSENTIWSKPIPKEFDRDLVELAFLWSARAGNPKLNKTSIEELKSTGSFSLIENIDLKNAINYYYATIEWRLGETNMAYSLRIRNNWQEELIKDGVLAQDISNVENPIGLIKGDLKRIGNIRAIIRATWFKFNSANILEQLATELIELIEAEISK